MTGPRENPLEERIRQQLGRQADELDELTVARLAAARRRALDGARRPQRAWLPVIGTAAAAALVLAVLLWREPAGLPGTLDDLDILASGDELELIEELDFYDWLDQTEASG